MVIQVIALCRHIKHYHMQACFLCVMGRIFVCACASGGGGAHTIEAGDAQNCAALTVFVIIIKKRSVGRLGEVVENVSQQRLK